MARIVSFKIDEETLEKLDTISRILTNIFDTNLTRSEIIRATIKKFIEEYENDPLTTIKDFFPYISRYRPLFKPYNRNRG